MVNNACRIADSQTSTSKANGCVTVPAVELAQHTARPVEVATRNQFVGRLKRTIRPCFVTVVATHAIATTATLTDSLHFPVHIVETVMWICIALCIVLGVPFTLLWWRDMDKWADAEHKKFKPKEKKPVGTTVVIRSTQSQAASDDAERGPTP